METDDAGERPAQIENVNSGNAEPNRPSAEGEQPPALAQTESSQPVNGEAIDGEANGNAVNTNGETVQPNVESNGENTTTE